MKKIIKRLLLFTSATTIVTSSINMICKLDL